jgi:molybdopterin synthase catalytic subunit/molybdopterin converting factor small subunit
VRVTVRLFAGLRERAGWSRREIDGVAQIGDVWTALELGDEPPGLLYALNKSYVERDRKLADGDEVALIPPVSGGAFLLSEQPLSLEAVVEEVASEEAGAVATFVGTTRVHSRGRTVTLLEYEAYEGMAEQVMSEIADELIARYDVCGIAIHHRIGRVGIGERSVVIAVSAPHRQDALAACKDAIDTLKERVPLWKKEVYVGGEEWIGRGS